MSLNKHNMPAWQQEIERALNMEKECPESRYLQLATVDENQRPAVRTVVFRGFSEQQNAMLVHTDMRSQKVAQLRVNPDTQLCWYFRQSRQQFRLSGTFSIVHKDTSSHAELELREQQWSLLSDSAKSAYLWSTPGQVYNFEEPQNPPTNSANPRDIDPVSPNFALMVFNIQKIDYLSLKSTPHKRIVHQLIDHKWQSTQINP